VRLARLLSEGFIPGVGLPRGNLRESSAGLAEDGSGAGPPAPRASSPAGQRRGCSTSILPQCVSPARSTSSTSWRRPRRGRASSSLQPGSGRVAGRRSRTRSSSRIPCRAAQGVLNVYLAAMWHRQRYRRRPRRGRASSSLQPGSGRVATAGCATQASKRARAAYRIENVADATAAASVTPDRAISGARAEQRAYSERPVPLKLPRELERHVRS